MRLSARTQEIIKFLLQGIAITAQENPACINNGHVNCGECAKSARRRECVCKYARLVLECRVNM